MKTESARVEKLRKQLAETGASVEVGVRAGLARRQGELNQLERDIRQAEQSLAGFRQKLHEISSAEYENQRLNIDAEKVLREIVTFATTLNLIECEEIYPINWELLGQIVTGGDSLCALITRFMETHRRTEKPVPAE